MSVPRLHVLVLLAFCVAPFAGAQQAAASAAARHEVRQHFSVTSPNGIDDFLLANGVAFLLEDVEIIDSSGLFSDPMMSSLHQFLLQFVLYRTSCDSAAGLQVAPAVPDCMFDKELGFACSDDQASRAKAAAEGKASRY